MVKLRRRRHFCCNAATPCGLPLTFLSLRFSTDCMDTNFLYEVSEKSSGEHSYWGETTKVTVTKCIIAGLTLNCDYVMKFDWPSFLGMLLSQRYGDAHFLNSSLSSLNQRYCIYSLLLGKQITDLQCNALTCGSPNHPPSFAPKLLHYWFTLQHDAQCSMKCVVCNTHSYGIWTTLYETMLIMA